MKLTDIIEFVLNNNGSAFFYTPKIYNGKSILFKALNEKIECRKKEDLEDALNKIDELRAREEGFLVGDYEVGYFFENKFNHVNKNAVLKAFFYDNAQIVKFTPDEIEYNDIKKTLSDNNFEIKNKKLNVTKDEYINAVKKVKEYISKGDTYQINYTIKTHLEIEGSLLSLILKLIFNQSAEYISIINDENKIIISISPELFFKTDNGKIIAKPMKGTIKRGLNLAEDELNKSRLFESKKDRAENVMIVDLLRNDIGKISELNSVKVTKLYDVEKYETVYQMTSTVEGRLKSENLYDLFKALYPCGSITGAPKIRTMEIINELEKEERGVYTGTIGLLGKDVKFNIPIRTISIDKNNMNAEIGIGSGVVWDSIPELEFEETKLKSDFLIKSDNYFELLETMLYEDGDIFLLDYHLKRLSESAKYFLFNCDIDFIEGELKKIISNSKKDERYKLRLTLKKWGEIAIDSEKLNNNEDKKYVKVYISERTISSKNKFQYFKTTMRDLYNQELKKAINKGYDEVIFLNERGEVCEGAISNIFLEINGSKYTPPVNSGILAGCYREMLINENKVKEKVISMNDLIDAENLSIANSVRKERVVCELFNRNGLIKKYKQ